MQNLTSCCLLAWYVLHLMSGMVDTSEDCEICYNLIFPTRAMQVAVAIEKRLKQSRMRPV